VIGIELGVSVSDSIGTGNVARIAKDEWRLSRNAGRSEK